MLLERYVRRDFPTASVDDRIAFAQLLDLPDPVLTDYLFGHVAPKQRKLAGVIERIAAHRD